MKHLHEIVMVGAAVLLWLIVSGGAIALFAHGGILADAAGTLLGILALAALFGVWMIWQAATLMH